MSPALDRSCGARTAAVVTRSSRGHRIQADAVAPASFDVVSTNQSTIECGVDVVVTSTDHDRPTEQGDRTEAWVPLDNDERRRGIAVTAPAAGESSV